MKGIDGEFRSEPDLTTAAERGEWRNSGYPPGFTVDELRFYRKKRAPSENQPGHHLTLESGDFKELKSEYRRRFRDYYEASTRDAFAYDLKDLSPSRACKPGDHLSLVEGDDAADEDDDDGGKSSAQEFQTKYHESFIEFPIERRPVNTHRRYKRQLDAMPRSDDHSQSFGNPQSENRAQFVQHAHVEHALPIRRSTSLKLVGDFSHTTEKAEQFIKYLLDRRSAIRRSTNLRLEGAMENSKTETRDKFTAYEVQPRPVLYKKLTSLRLEGDLDITTENHEQFIPYSTDPSEIRPPLVKRSTNLRLEGDLRMSPEYRHEFVEHPGSERSSPSLPRHNLRVDGFFNSVTENQEKFVGHQMHPPIPFLRGSAFDGKLLLGDEKHVGRAEYREKFIPHNIERSAAHKRGQNLRLEGEIDTLTENRHAYVEHQRQQPPARWEQRAQNLQLEGQFDMSPEYKNAYVDFYKTSNFSSPVRRRRVEPTLKSEGVMETDPEYKRAFIDFPRQRPEKARKPETHLSSEGEMDHMTEKRAQYVEYPGHRKPDALKREPEFKLEGDFVCQPEYRKAYVNYLIRERVDHKHRPLDNLTGVAVLQPQRAFEILNPGEKKTDGAGGAAPASTTTTTTITTTTTTDTITSGETKQAVKSMIPIATPASATSTTATTTAAAEETAYSADTNSRIPRRIASLNTLETQLFGPKIEPPKTFRSSSSSRMTSRSPSPLPPRSSRTRSLSRSSKATKGSSSAHESDRHRDRTGSRFSKSVKVEDLAYTPATSPIPTHKIYNFNYSDRKKWEKPKNPASINPQIDRMTAFMIIDDDNNNQDNSTDRNFIDKSYYKEQKWMSSWNSPTT